MNATDHLAEVAVALQAAGLDVVFVGGATIPLYLDPLGAGAARATEDIDCIVNCVLAAEYADVEEALRRGRFDHCMAEDAPICRWTFITAAGHAVLVDVMPVSDILGFENRYYPATVAAAETVLLNGVSIRLPTPGYALATKVAAWCDRGNDDPAVSEDFEDIVALADGCSRLVPSATTLPEQTRIEVATVIRGLLARPDIRALVQAMVPQPPIPTRVTNCLAVLQALADLDRSAESAA